MQRKLITNQLDFKDLGKIYYQGFLGLKKLSLE